MGEAPRALGGVVALAFAAGHDAHVVSDEQVLVLGGSRRPVVLRGRAYVLVVQLIDGRTTEDEIVAALAGRVEPAVAHLVLTRLAERGLVVIAESGSVSEAETVALPGPGELRCIGVGVPDAIVARLAAAAEGVVSPRGLTVLVVDDYRRPELDRLAARCRAAGAALLPVRAAGPGWWLGPYCEGAGAGETWRRFRVRFLTGRHDSDEVVSQDDARLAAAAAVVKETLRGAPPSSVRDAVLVLDDEGSTVHRIAVAKPDDLTPLVSPITGIVAGLERVPAVEGTHVYATTGTLEWPDEGLPIFRGGALGKGLTDAQARASCLGEAAELVSATFTGDETRRRARWSEIEDVAIHPRELLLESFDEQQAIDWVPLVSLVDGETRWLPAACCYFGHDAPFSTATANGCAAGRTLDDAVLGGLLELIERDACALWWYSRARRPAIDLDSLGDPRLSAIRDAHVALGRELALLDLRTDTGATVVAAVAWDRATGAALPAGRGCHLDPAVAVAHALVELSQVTAIAPSGPTGTIAERPYLVPADGPSLVVGDLPAVTKDEVVATLAGLGHDVLVLETTRADIGVPAARVVVPGLRPLERRLAPGRLYDVPPRIGWIPHALRADELNPHEFVS